MFKFLCRLFKIKNKSPTETEDYSCNYTQHKVEGQRNIATGVEAKISPTGICTNSDIIPVEEKIKDPLNPINRCIFCSESSLCYFDGECENKKQLEE